MKKIITLLFVMALFVISAPAMAVEDDIELTSVEIVESDVRADRVVLYVELTPGDANGVLDYEWESSNENIATVSGKEEATVRTTGSDGTAEITVTVFQTLPISGLTIERASGSYQVRVKGGRINGESDDSSGCNAGVFAFALLMTLPLLFRRRK